MLEQIVNFFWTFLQLTLNDLKATAELKVREELKAYGLNLFQFSLSK